MKKLYFILLLTLISLLTFSSFSADIILEAETGNINGVTISNIYPGYSGTGYIEGFDLASDQVSLNFTATAGLYEVIIGYATPFGPKGYTIQVNGERSSGMFPQNDSFTVASSGKYLLKTGDNNISILANWGWYYIDYIKVVPAVINPPIAPTPALIDTKATASTKALYKYMLDLYGKKTLSGQQDDLNYILNTTGKEPAIGAFDLIDYSPSRIQFSAYPAGKSESYINWAKKGTGRGIVSLCWHWNAPTDLINLPPDKLWWSGFYTTATTFDLQLALSDTASERYKLLLRDIDAIAVELKKFEAADVPVLWRPLHEAPGGWFWWGAKGAEPFKALWKILYNRLENYHNIHNLIWVYTGTADTSWYPGDNFVDIFGLDIYSDPSSSLSVQWEEIQTMLKSINSKKMVTLSETGNLPDPDKIRAYGTRWSWFANWTGSYITNQPADFVKRVFNDVDVITLDELPDWRAGGNQNLPPVVALSIDKPSYTASATIILTAAASDTDGQVAKVEFYNGATLLATDVAAPYTFSWANVGVGNYSLTARATDNSGNTTTSTIVTASVISNNIPPVVSLVTNGVSYVAPASIVLTATATDSDGTISKVEFYNGATLLATDITAPYSFTWANVSAGNYSLTAKATDNSGNVATSTVVAVSVITGNKPPVVSLVSNNASYLAPANVALTATATDSDGTISKVEFYNGTTLLATDAAAPYSFTWTNVGAGNYSLTAKATDNSGNVGTSAPISISVTSPNNQIPVVSLVSDKTSYSAPATVVLTATASDADGTISKVEFYNGETLINSDITSPYTFTWSNVAAGSYTLKAKAYDNLAAVGTSATITITVTPVSSEADIIGPDCGGASQSAIFELNPKYTVGATSYTWWYNGSSQSITPLADPSKVNMLFGPYFSAGSICVGVSYSQAPYYRSFCKPLTKCAATSRMIDANDTETSELLITPNPVRHTALIQSGKAINEIMVINSTGKVVLKQNNITLSKHQITFDPSTPAGIYHILIGYKDGKKENKTIFIER